MVVKVLFWDVVVFDNLVAVLEELVSDGELIFQKAVLCFQLFQLGGERLHSRRVNDHVIAALLV